MSLFRYNQILKKNRKSVSIPTVLPYIPKLKDTDYENGYVRRYFAQKANDKDSQIFEINKNSFTNLNSISYYIVVGMDWRLKGLPEEVKKSNRASIQIASNTIKNLSLYLPNLLQFHKK